MNKSAQIRFMKFLVAVCFTACACIVNTFAESCSMSNENHEIVNKIDSLLRSSSSGSNLPFSPTGGVKQVQVVYISPSDVPYNPEYTAAITDAVLHLQDFYQQELGQGNTFQIKPPDFAGQKVVEWKQSTQTADWFVNNPNGSDFKWYFYRNSLDQGFALLGGYSPDYIHLFFIDVQPNCCQGAGGTGSGGNGDAVLTGGDLRGLVGLQDTASCHNGNPSLPNCPGGQDLVRRYRYIGGVGHELGHAFGLAHSDIGCNSYKCIYSIMSIGYREYPSFLTSDHVTELLNSNFVTPTDLRKPRDVDFDVDRKTDYSVWRPAGTPTWYVSNSSGRNYSPVVYGLSSDLVTPDDYDGDRKTDIAVWRPSDATFYVRKSSDGAFIQQQWGATGDIPVPGDYDGDLVTDFGVFRPSNGTWLIKRSASSTTLSLIHGQSGDVPVPADYNGDKRVDLAVFRPSGNSWIIRNEYSHYFYYPSPYGYVVNPTELPQNTTVTFGLSGDKLVPADYNGDGKAEIAVFRPSSGYWYIYNSGGYSATQYGQSGDIPVPGDYDDDGKSDIAVWRPGSNSYYYILKSSNGSTQVGQWGTTGDVPLAAAYVRP